MQTYWVPVWGGACLGASKKVHLGKQNETLQNTIYYYLYMYISQS